MSARKKTNIVKDIHDHLVGPFDDRVEQERQRAAEEARKLKRWEGSVAKGIRYLEELIEQIEAARAERPDVFDRIPSPTLRPPSVESPGLFAVAFAEALVVSFEVSVEGLTKVWIDGERDRKAGTREPISLAGRITSPGKVALRKFVLDALAREMYGKARLTFSAAREAFHCLPRD